MLGLIVAALRHRRAQAFTVLVLATFAVAAAVASPWYVAGAADRAATVDLAGAAPRERLVSVTRSVTVRDSGAAVDPLAQARTTVPSLLVVPGAVHVFGASQTGNVTAGSVTATLPVAYRDGMCEHLTVAGRCPRAPDEALLTTAQAEHLGLRVGDPLQIKPAFGDGQSATLVGTYAFTDPGGPYWAGTRYVGQLGHGSAAADPVFVSLSTYGGPALQQVLLTDDVRLPDDAYRGSAGAGLSTLVGAAAHRLNPEGYSTDFTGQALADRLAGDQQTIRVGVPVGAAALLALCWFAFFLAGRYAARERRTEIALLKLRGAGTGRQLRLAAGQVVAPMLGGALLGGALGVAAARALAGAVRPDSQPAALRACLVTAGAAVVGALLAVLLAQWRTLRTPVAELLRGVPPRRRGWRTDLVDLLVVAVAVAAGYQAKAQGTGRAAGLAPLARGLVTLAAALLLARLVGLLVAGLGGSALRAGRLRFALGALQITRRPGMDRVFALLMVAVAGLVTSAVDWSAASAARDARASQEIGAATVVSVQSDNRSHMMAAVRAADPTGTHAMAVVYRPQAGTTPAVLAVDAGRLAAVADWQPGYGVEPAALARQLRPAGPAPLLVHGATLTVRAGADAAGSWLVARLVNLDTGVAQQADYGPLPATPTQLSAPVACAGGAGCRLVWLGVAGAPGAVPGGYLPVGHPVTVQVLDVSQRAPDRQVAGPDVLGDIARWHAGFAAHTVVLGAGDGALRLIDAAPGPDTDQHAYALDTPVPLPVVAAGATARLWPAGDPRLAPLGGDTLPIRVVGSLPALPVLGGVGVLVDLNLASQLDTAAAGLESQQVWLAPDAPPGIVDQLRAAGLVVTGTSTIAATRGALADQGPTSALRFALFVALLGLALAVTAVAVAAAGETGPRSAELAALRAQGVPARAARAVSYGGYVGLVVAGVLGGVLAALLARALVGTGLPPFVDTWNVLPVSTGIRAYPLLLATGGALVVLGVAAAVAGRRLVRATTARTGPPGGGPAGRGATTTGGGAA